MRRDAAPTLARVHGHALRTGRLDKKRLEEERRKKEGKRNEKMLLL
jgi:hypothetical protein